MPERKEGTSDQTDDVTTSIRGFEPGDISACALLAEDAWPAEPGTISKELETSGMRGYMEYSLNHANWTDIAYTSGGVVGLLFGRIDNLPGASKPKKSLLGELPTFLRTFLLNDRVTSRSLGFVWSLALTELKLRIMMPESDASIEMFIVHSRHRGKGIGNELIDRFLKAARDAGSSLVTVYTDDRMSNWQFYERRGFKRVGTFHDNITSHYSGLYSRGIIFALDLSEERRKNVGESFH
jgi:ribosomal protein S18 acetylase RimI-like enzyme